MFLADDLQNEIKTYFRAFPWKRPGGRRRGSEAAGLRQRGCFILREEGLCLFLAGAAYFQVSAVPRWQQLNACTQGCGQRGERGRPCKTGTQQILRITGGELAAAPASLPPGTGNCAARSLLTAIFQAGKTPNRLLCSRSTLSKVLLKRGNEPICILLLKHGGMFLVTLHCVLSFAPGLLVG